jgi:hypothetical protein
MGKKIQERIAQRPTLVVMAWVIVKGRNRFMAGKACLVAAVGAVVVLSTSAKGMDISDQQMRDEVARLRTRVAGMEAREARETAEMAATVERVLRDAEGRSQLMANGDGGAGYDNGFFIKAGETVIKPGFNLQFRSVTDYRSNTNAKGDQTESGFEIRRMQFKLEGTALTSRLYYFFQWNTNNNTGSVYLEDAFVKHSFAPDWAIRSGQFKEQLTHEKITSDTKLLAVDRSLLDATLGGGWFDRVQGVGLIYGGQAKGKALNAEVDFLDGSKSLNSDFTGHVSDPPLIGQVSAPNFHNFDFGVTARAEYMAMGDWANYSDFTARGLKNNLLVLGGGVEWNQGGDGDTFGGTVDVTLKHTCGGTLYGAAIVREITKDLSATGEDQTNWGFLVQASYLMNPAWEAFARYSFIRYDSKIMAAGNEADFHEIGVGVAYYLGDNGQAGNKAKITVDLNWLPNGAPAAYLTTGYEGDSRGDNEVALRGQFQLAL